MEERRTRLDRRRTPETVQPERASGPIPTQRGDVLILRTAKAFTINAVGQVESDGQQDFHGQTNTKYIHDRREAEMFASALAKPSGRVFVRNIDTAEWFEIPEGGTHA
jgi:hypothetical protein